jgi:putative transposase
MYEWRKMTPRERQETLKLRKQKRIPWHSPPHYVSETEVYHLTAACYEHKHVLGASVGRLSEFTSAMLSTVAGRGGRAFSWCVLPNHYHILVHSRHLHALIQSLGRLHGRTSYLWNGEDDKRGRQVWHGLADRFIRSERHFWVTMNYIHHNAVHHGYAARWQDWPFSSAESFLKQMGRKRAAEIWRAYPLRGYGKGWDERDP